MKPIHLVCQWAWQQEKPSYPDFFALIVIFWELCKCPSVLFTVFFSVPGFFHQSSVELHRSSLTWMCLVRGQGQFVYRILRWQWISKLPGNHQTHPLQVLFFLSQKRLSYPNVHAIVTFCALDSALPGMIPAMLIFSITWNLNPTVSGPLSEVTKGLLTLQTCLIYFTFQHSTNQNFTKKLLILFSHWNWENKSKQNICQSGPSWWQQLALGCLPLLALYASSFLWSVSVYFD